MRILLHVTLTTMLRHFEGVVLSLADRGHTVRIARQGRRPDLPPPASLAGHERISFVTSPARRSDEWGAQIHRLRLLRDYLRYMEKPYRNAPKLRARALRKLMTGLTDDHESHAIGRCPHCDKRLVDDEVGRMMFPFRKAGRKNVEQLLSLMEATIPSDPAIEAFLRDERPDVLLVTPLINFGSRQPDFVKSAKALGVPVGFPAFSWDNLSNKGLIHVVPDRVFVWNEQQRIEAVRMHHVPPEQIVVTGAPRFDDFFAMTPQVSRAEFCAAHGFDVEQPIVTYLCSSEFVSDREIEFVTRWIGEVRQAPALGGCNILIRPHPREQKQWKAFEAPGRAVAVSLPLAINADQTLFDTVYHSAAIVGLNTSAQLEAGIVGRPVLTILAPEYAEGQEGTVHFRYLLKEDGGFVDVAPDFETHRQQLTAAVGGDFDRDQIRAFIERFLRPRGLHNPAAPILVEAIEELARSGAAQWA
jgi:hypothetical protein